ncbi:MAG: hypothetical protein WDA37_06850 [Dysgonamonadaceae bacterium]
MAERPPTTVRLCLDLTAAETAVELPSYTEGAVGGARIIGWHADLGAASPYIQVRFSGGLTTHSLCGGSAALRSDCVQLPCASANYVATATETAVPIRHYRDFPMRFAVSVFDAATPPAPLTPVRLVIWVEIDLV